MSTYQKTSLISVDEAIAKGRQMLLLPRIFMIVGLFFFLFPIALFVMALMDGPPFTRGVWLVFGGVMLFCFVVFFFLPFLFWSKRTIRWKLWAFDNVDNVHELKIMASETNLCPAYGTVMDKLQIHSAAEREQWRELQNRFDFPEVFIDDPTISAETIIYFSKAQQIAGIIFGLFLIGTGIMLVYFVSKGDHSAYLYIVGLVIALAPTAMIFIAVKRMINKEPQLILNNKGFYSKATGFLNWDVIYNVKVKSIVRPRRGTQYILNFQHPGGLENIDITEFNINKGPLERLIRFYKGRYNTRSI